MGQTQAAAVADIDLTRRRLDSELEELATYLPPTTAWMKRGATIAAGVVAGLALLSFALRRWREGRTDRHLRAIEHRLARMEERLPRR
jgi:hypothetical protein